MSTRFLLQTFSWESITRFSTACAAYEEPITRPTRICHTQLLANGRFLDSASGPALTCGNSVVLKTAEQTPLSARYAGNLFLEAGLLPGVLNIISGFGPAGAALCSHVVVDKLAITGSTAMGKTVLALAAASNLKPVTLEVGGKSIFIVCEDADVDKAVELVHFALFYNQGQCCGAGSRIYVHERVYDEYLEKAKARAVECVVGDSFKKDNILIAQDEIFGPVQSISKFRDINEVIERANTASFGLAAGVLTHDIDVTTIWPVN